MRTRAVAVGALAALSLLLGSCLISPVRYAPTVDAKVVDAVSGEPLEGALVVVRYDGRYDDLLPDREVLGHVEARSDARGRVRLGPLFKAGTGRHEFHSSNRSRPASRSSATWSRNSRA